jgi:hypothetical protein
VSIKSNIAKPSCPPGSFFVFRAPIPITDRQVSAGILI